jgi:hypothetical protein
MKERINYRYMCFVLTLILGLSTFANAKQLKGTIRLNTVGTGIIEEDNVDKAREKAIQNALAAAVETTVNKILPPNLIVENFQLINDRIFNPIQKFVRGFRVLAEVKSNEFYRVFVKSTVSVDTIRSNLSEIGVKAKKKNLPSILTFISEQNIHQEPYQWWRIKPLAPRFNPAGSELTSFFKKKNYKIVDQQSLVRKLWARSDFQQDHLDKTEALQFAKTNNVQIVLIGHVKALPSMGVFGMASVDAEIQLQAYQSQTGMLIAETTQNARAVKENEIISAKEAVTKAANQAAQTLAKQLEVGLQKAAINASQIELLVNGTQKLAYFVTFRKVLAQDIQGVAGIHLKELKANNAKIIVEFPEGGEVLAKRLILKMQSIDSFGLNMQQISSDKIELGLISKDELKKKQSGDNSSDASLD